MKGVHGAGMTVSVTDGAATCAKNNSRYCPVGVSGVAGLSFLRDTCTHWLGLDFGVIHGERSYSSIRPGCIFEELLLSFVDVKVYAFHGVPHWAMLQFGNLHQATRANRRDTRYGFTEEGELRPLKSFCVCIPMTANHCGRMQSAMHRWCAADFEAERVLIPRPAIRRMYLATRRLYKVLLASRGATQVRIDFLLVNGTQPAFGEFTFTNANCQHKLVPHLADGLYGRAGAPAGSALTHAGVHPARASLRRVQPRVPFLRNLHTSSNGIGTRTVSGGIVANSMDIGNFSTLSLPVGSDNVTTPFLAACMPRRKMRLRPRSDVYAWLAQAERPSLRRLIKKIGGSEHVATA